MFKFPLLVVFTTLFITACGDEQVFSEQYYRDNEQAKLEKIAYCNENPDEKLISLNCINALSVSSQQKIEAQKGSGLAVDFSQADKTEDTKKERSHDKNYYVENSGERLKQISTCNKLSEAKKWANPNCAAAMAADAYLKATKTK